MNSYDTEIKEGKSEKEAEAIAWATVNKQDGGGLKHPHDDEK